MEAIFDDDTVHEKNKRGRHSLFRRRQTACVGLCRDDLAMQGIKPARPEKRLRRKAKKIHHCYWCGEIINSGERYVVLEFIRPRSVELKFHEDCYEVAKVDPAVPKGKQSRYSQFRGCTVAETLSERQIAEENQHGRF